MSNLNITTLGESTFIDGDFNGKPSILCAEQGSVVETDSYRKPYMFNYTFREEDTVVFSRDEVEDVSYVLKDSSQSLKPRISKDIYSQLTSELKALYSKSVSHVEKMEPWQGSVEVFNLNAYALNNKELVVYGKTEVVEALLRLNFTNGVKNAMIQKHTSIRRDEEPSITVVFFDSDYEGETRKILDKKQNGQPYADRRGRTVPKYPTVVEQIKVQSRLIPSFSAGSQSEIDEKVRKYFLFLVRDSFAIREED